MSVNQIISRTNWNPVPARPSGRVACPPLCHPPLPRFPCTRCLRERSRAGVLQSYQSWRRIYNPSGFLVSLLRGVTGSLEMDVSSSSSNYPFKQSDSSCSSRVTVTDFPPSLNSEEAQSTTWLHPVGGDAIRTGHGKTPGKESVNGGQVSPLSPRCSPSCAAVWHFRHGARPELWHSRRNSGGFPPWEISPLMPTYRMPSAPFRVAQWVWRRSLFRQLYWPP